MGQEEQLEWAGRGALSEQVCDFSQSMLLVAASTGDSEAGRPDLSPILEELNWRAVAATSRELVQLHPWQVAARAKGRPGYFLAKRCLDVMLAVVALLVCSPLIIGVALLVRLTSPGPVFFRQERVGYGGRRFTIYKFRSMYVNCDDRLHRAAYEQFLRGERASGK
ncbi:MAG TPA: sugar transferase, partial [Ktedonobacteraceae bacterium]|nr:sugar transferase [Ktedonobacteraceae bacterium]